MASIVRHDKDRINAVGSAHHLRQIDWPVSAMWAVISEIFQPVIAESVLASCSKRGGNDARYSAPRAQAVLPCQGWRST